MNMAKGGKTIVVRFSPNTAPEDWKRLGEMLQEGYQAGLDRPLGMTWKLVTDRVAKKYGL